MSFAFETHLRRRREKLFGQLTSWCAVRRINLNVDVEIVQLCIKQRADFGPFQSTIATSERRKGDAANFPLGSVRQKVVETSCDVSQARWRTPMIFGRKVYDPNAGRIAIKIRLAEAHVAPLAARDIIFKHRGESLPEFQRHAFTLHADAVHRIHTRLRLRREKIANQCFEHGCSLCLSEK